MTKKQGELLQEARDASLKSLQAITWLNGRVAEIEQWKENHPRLCPMEKKQRDILKVRALEMAVAAVVLTVLQIILKVLKVL